MTCAILLSRRNSLGLRIFMLVQERICSKSKVWRSRDVKHPRNYALFHSITVGLQRDPAPILTQRLSKWQRLSHCVVGPSTWPANSHQDAVFSFSSEHHDGVLNFGEGEWGGELASQSVRIFCIIRGTIHYKVCEKKSYRMASSN